MFVRYVCLGWCCGRLENEGLEFCCHNIVFIRWVVGTCYVSGVRLMGGVLMKPCFDFFLGLVICLVRFCSYLCDVCFLCLYVDEDNVGIVSYHEG